MRKLYKQFPAYDRGYLQVSDLHKIYYEQSGNPGGKPVVVLHGGPGSKSKPKYRKYFNPKKWRVVLFDQRGCGKSRPRGELEENTTSDLVDDIEKIRKHLNIPKWTIFGGSWGSTLGLAYAEKYPKVISEMILGSIFLCRKKDIEWLFGGNALKHFYPDLWELRQTYLKKLKMTSGKEYDKLYKVLTSGTLKEKKIATIFFENWESQFMAMGQEIRLIKLEEVKEEDILDDKILMHYVVNDLFLEENQLIRNVKKLPKVPTVIIHGRLDMDCPFENAWELKKAILHATLEIIPDAGHHSSEPGTIGKLVEYTDKFADN
jgi:proline iminopeptidase